MVNELSVFEPLNFYCISLINEHINGGKEPGRVKQSVGHLTRKSEVEGSIPDLDTYFRFSFR